MSLFQKEKQGLISIKESKEAEIKTVLESWDNSRAEHIRELVNWKSVLKNSPSIQYKEKYEQSVKDVKEIFWRFQAYLIGVLEEKNGGNYGEAIFDEIIII